MKSSCGGVRNGPLLYRGSWRRWAISAVGTTLRMCRQVARVPAWRGPNGLGGTIGIARGLPFVNSIRRSVGPASCSAKCARLAITQFPVRGRVDRIRALHAEVPRSFSDKCVRPTARGLTPEEEGDRTYGSQYNGHRCDSPRYCPGESVFDLRLDFRRWLHGGPGFEAMGLRVARHARTAPRSGGYGRV